MKRRVALLFAFAVIFGGSSTAQAASSVDTLGQIQMYMDDSGDNSHNNWVCNVYFGNVYCYQV